MLTQLMNTVPRLSRAVFLLTTGLSASSQVCAQQNSENAERIEDAALLQPCYGCHGFQGHSQSRDVPSFDHLEETRFLDKMHQFQTDPGSGSIMPRIAVGYDESQIMRMIRYLYAN